MEKISTCLLLFPLLIHENSFAEHSGKSSNQREVASSRVRPQIELHSRLFVSNGDCSMTIVRDPKASFYEGKKWRDACLFSRNWTTATGTTWPLWPACSNFLPLKLNEEVHTSRQLVRKLKFLATIWHYHVCWGYANFAKICSLLYLLLLKTSPQWVQTLICLLAFLPHFARSEHFSLIQSTLSIWKFFQGSLKQNIVPCKSIKSHYLIHHNRFIFWIGGTLEAMTSETGGTHDPLGWADEGELCWEDLPLKVDLSWKLPSMLSWISSSEQTIEFMRREWAFFSTTNLI